MMRKRDNITDYFIRAFIKIDGETYLWYEIKFISDDEKEVIWHLPKEKTDEYVKRCLDNIGIRMSEYVYCHPDCSLIE